MADIAGKQPAHTCNGCARITFLNALLYQRLGNYVSGYVCHALPQIGGGVRMFVCVCGFFFFLGGGGVLFPPMATCYIQCREDYFIIAFLNPSVVRKKCLHTLLNLPSSF